jgi:SAM-dependent methyltransferase
MRAHGYRTMEEGFDTLCLHAGADPRVQRAWSRLRPAVAGVSVEDEPQPEPHPDLLRLTPEDRRYLTTLHDDSVPLPPGAERELSRDSPRLADLRARYAALDLPVLEASRWNDEAVAGFLDLRWFRGETLITWHYRELRRVSELKFFVLAQYVRERDALGLLDRLEEDGAFGCWTFAYPGHRRYSRDLLESVNELSFLERRLRLSEQPSLRVLDVGAGYGRLAHRFAEAHPHLADYCCVDAVPESTFVSEFYLRHRGVVPPARVVPLDRVEADLEPGGFDLAVNVHSFSECTEAAVAWWIALLARLDVPRLLIVPNEPTELLTLEADGSRRDFAPLLERAGYRLSAREPVIEDEAVRSLVRLEDHFHLFERG